MKSVSPWFQTANLLDGIRKALSNIEASRHQTTPFDGRSAASGRPQSAGKSKQD